MAARRLRAGPAGAFRVGRGGTAMTPQERQLIADLFERLAALENQPRDPEAEQAIREGLAKAPHAVYPLVQSVLVQDEALKQADAYIRELEDAAQGGPQGGPQGAGQNKGFLDSMRGALFGRDERRGSVPSVRPGEEPMGVPPQYRGGAGGSPWGSAGAQPQQQWGGGQQQWGGGQPGGPMAQGAPRGGSFLGTAAAAAAGMVGGGLLLSGIRNMLGGGQGQHGPFAGAFDQIAGGGQHAPLGGTGGGELARDAGLGDIGRGGGRDYASNDSDTDHGSAGAFDSHASAGDDDVGDDADFDDDSDAGGDDTDYA